MDFLTKGLQGTDWENRLQEALQTSSFESLHAFLQNAYQNATVFPPVEQIFRAFQLTSFHNVRVVILGQDPYHGLHQADGLAFSVSSSQPIPPSLRNIFKELHQDLGIIPAAHGNLESWAKQGVFLLNTTLTVLESKAGSHQNRGWEPFTDQVIDVLSKQKEGLVFVLWGNHAQKKGAQIDRTKHLVLEAAHPSPLSAYRGFWESRPFSKINAYLTSQKGEPIDWKIITPDLFNG